jgi:hypothetical protein
MGIGIATPVRNALADAAAAKFDAGPGAATIEVRTGGKPANPQAAATGTLLFTFTLADPSWGVAAAGVATLDATPVIVAVAVAAGTAGWWRAKDSTGATVMDGTAGITGSGADLILDNTTVAIGQNINLTAGTMTEPES